MVTDGTGENVHQGERLMLLVKRSGKSNSEVGAALDILPNSVSRLFKSEKLSKKVLTRAAAFFNVSEDYFTAQLPETVPRPDKYREQQELIQQKELRIQLLLREIDEMRERLVREQQLRNRVLTPEQLLIFERLQNLSEKFRNNEN